MISNKGLLREQLYAILMSKVSPCSFIRRILPTFFIIIVNKRYLSMQRHEQKKNPFLQRIINQNRKNHLKRLRLIKYSNFSNATGHKQSFTAGTYNSNLKQLHKENHTFVSELHETIKRPIKVQKVAISSNSPQSSAYIGKNQFNSTSKTFKTFKRYSSVSSKRASLKSTEEINRRRSSKMSSVYQRKTRQQSRSKTIGEAEMNISIGGMSENLYESSFVVRHSCDVYRITLCNQACRIGGHMATLTIYRLIANYEIVVELKEQNKEYKLSLDEESGNIFFQEMEYDYFKVSKKLYIKHGQLMLLHPIYNSNKA